MCKKNLKKGPLLFFVHFWWGGGPPLKNVQICLPCNFFFSLFFYKIRGRQLLWLRNRRIGRGSSTTHSIPELLRTPAVQMGILILVTWVPQKRQGKLHCSLRGCSAPPSVLHESTPQKLTGPSALQRIFLLLTRGADNWRPDYRAPSCPISCDFGTTE